MKTLSKGQKAFLLEYFFKNEKYAGWQGIATKLLEDGCCVVAGTDCIWIGGIGNFIKTIKADGYFGCLHYTFDLEYFLSSEWCKQVKESYMEILSDKKRDIIREYSEILNL